MKTPQKLAAGVLTLIACASLSTVWLAPNYAVQNRDFISSPPCGLFLLGTDELGRDNLSRMLTGLRASLALASISAAAACCMALLAGAVSGYVGGWIEQLVLQAISLIESIPWLFLFLAIRSSVPLNASPAVFLWITFFILAVFGWTHAGRVIQAAARDIRKSDAVLFARACGISGWRLVWRQAAPCLRQIFLNQFTILIPTFVLAEAGLGLLGLGIPEPEPSLGNLLRELQRPETIRSHPVVLVPLALLIIVVVCLRSVCGDMEETA